MPTDDAHPIGILSSTPSSGESAERGHGSTETGTAAVQEERRALGWAAMGAVAAVAWLVRPVGVGILLGTLLAFALQPLFERLKPRLGARWSALTIVIGSVLALAGIVGGLGWLFVSKGAALAHQWSIVRTSPGLDRAVVMTQAPVRGGPVSS